MPTFPTTTLLDNFNYSESPINGTKWGKLGESGANGKATGTVYNVGETGNIAAIQSQSANYWKAEEFTSPGAAVLTGSEVNHAMCLLICLQNPATEATGYQLRAEANGSANAFATFELYEWKKGSGTLLKKLESPEPTTKYTAGTDLIGLSVAGGVLSGWIKKGAGAWELKLEVATTKFTKGFVGLGGAGTGVTMDNFEAGSGKAEKEKEELAATLASSGMLRHNIAHQLQAKAESLGTLTYNVAHGLPAKLESLGISGRAISRLASASLEFMGVLERQITRMLHAMVEFRGMIHRGIFEEVIKATLDFTGVLPRYMTHGIAASLSFLGHLALTVSRRLTATLDFVASLAIDALHILRASLAFAGTRQAIVTKTLMASASFVGQMRSRTIRKIIASLEFVHSLNEYVHHGFNAILHLEGNLNEGFRMRFEATLEFMGELSRSTTSIVAASISASGRLGRSIVHGLLGALSTAAVLPRVISKGLASVLTFFGSIAPIKRIIQRMRAILSFSDKLPRSIFPRAFRAGLDFVGRINKGLNQPHAVDLIILKERRMSTLTAESTEGGIFKLIEDMEGFPEMEFQSIVQKRHIQRRNG